MEKSTNDLEIFISYAHKDEALLDELNAHLSSLRRQGVIGSWYDYDINAGKDWQNEIDSHLNKADIILLLVSPDFVASDYAYSIEMKRALERHRAGEARVIPIILRPVDWQGAPFSKLQVLPTEGKPITRWLNHDEAFYEVTRGVRKAVQDLLETRVHWVDEGNRFMALKQYEEALAAYEQAIRLEPANAAAYIGKGNALLGILRYVEALVAYEQAIRLDPANAAAYIGKGNALFSLHRYEEALLAYEQVIHLSPKNKAAYMNEGHLLRKLGQYEKALVAYGQAIKLFPKDAEAYLYRGNTFQHLQKYERALQDYGQVLQLDPRNVTAHFDRGEVLQQLQQYEEALADYEAVIMLDPNNVRAYQGKATILRGLNRYDEASLAIERAFRLGLNVGDTTSANVVGDVEAPQPYTRIELIRQFLIKAGFNISTPANEVGFLAHAKAPPWKHRFPRGLYIRILFDSPLDQSTVRSIYQDSRKYSDHALVIINMQPAISGWGEINILRGEQSQRRFVCLPIDESLLQKGIASNTELLTLKSYIDKYLGKEFDPYDVRDPVSGAVSFFGRQRLTEELLDALRRGQRRGLFGIHKMGKTSVLQELRKRAEFPVAYVYLESGDTLDRIYSRIIDSWVVNGRLKYSAFHWTKPSTTDIVSQGDFDAAAKSLLTYLGTMDDIQPLLGVFLDEIERIVPSEGDQRTLQLYLTLMDSLRGLQQETNSLAMLVAGVHPSIARRNYFWSNQKNPMHQVIVEQFLPPLDEDDCSYMIRSLGQQINLQYEESALKYILDMSGSHPFLARQICSLAYKKRRDMRTISVEIVEKVIQEFVRNPSTASYFDEYGLWGELSKLDLWEEAISEANHRLLCMLAGASQDLSENELCTGAGIDKKVAIQSFYALKERSIISSPDNSGYYRITFGLFRNWIRFHQLGIV